MEEVAVAAAEWNGRFEFAETRRLVVELLEREPLIATALPTECGVRIRFAGDEHPEGIGLHGLTIEGIARVRAWRARARDPRVDRTR